MNNITITLFLDAFNILLTTLIGIIAGIFLRSSISTSNIYKEQFNSNKKLYIIVAVLSSILLFFISKDYRQLFVILICSIFSTVIEIVPEQKNLFKINPLMLLGVILFYLSLLVGLLSIIQNISATPGDGLLFWSLFMMGCLFIFSSLYQNDKTKVDLKNKKKEITIKVDSELADIFNQESEQVKIKYEIFLNIQLQEAIENNESLQFVMSNISRKAQEKGMTPEILQSILDDE